MLCYALLKFLPPAFIEQNYSRGFYQWVRKFFDNSFGKLPFPAYYLFVLVIFLIILKWFLHFFKEKPQPFSQRVFVVASFIGFMITLFFVLWGFNYGRIPIDKYLNFSNTPLTTEQLTTETKTTIEHLTTIRNTILKDTGSMPEIIFVNNIEQNSRDALDSTLHTLQYPFSTKIRGRFLFDDMLLFFGIGGQYMPYVGESNVDDAVYYSKKPFYLIHEMAHGNGFTEEATCNFLAYVSCVESGNLSLAYSGEINYLLYLINALQIADTTALNAIKDTMPPNIKKDLQDMALYYKKHTFKTGVIGDNINNIYLKFFGVSDGVKNYDKMVQLVYAWKQKEQN